MHLKQKHPHLQVILSIGGPQSSQIFPTAAGNAAFRDNFARSARGLVEASGLDGIDSTRHTLPPASSRTDPRTVVWQYPTDAHQGANFLALLAAVRMYLPEEHYLLTAALPASRTVLATIDLRRAADYLDLLNLKAFDFFGHWSPRSGHHAQLYPSSSKEDESACGAGAVAHLVAQGFPARKILFGIPLFGRSFPGVTGPGHRFSKPSGDGALEYHQLPRKGAKEIVDRRAGAAFCVSSGSTGFTSYDNPETVKMKASFVKKKGLGVRTLQITHLFARLTLTVQIGTFLLDCSDGLKG